MVKNRLKEIRMREYMMNQKEFAKLLKVDDKTYSNWEKNYSRPILEKALEIAKILNKRVEDIWFLE
ncbi:MAG: helix-turn-helix domain-containing protein [Caloramator sp.]|nr:helix-turn-helix domain-containing protein [Caloramator sp.]